MNDEMVYLTQLKQQWEFVVERACTNNDSFERLGLKSWLWTRAIKAS